MKFGFNCFLKEILDLYIINLIFAEVTQKNTDGVERVDEVVWNRPGDRIQSVKFKVQSQFYDFFKGIEGGEF
jgi:hypothetical protein